MSPYQSSERSPYHKSGCYQTSQTTLSPTEIAVTKIERKKKTSTASQNQITRDITVWECIFPSLAKVSRVSSCFLHAEQILIDKMFLLGYKLTCFSK